MQYNSLRSAIPKLWMCKINREHVNTFESKKNYYIRLRVKLTDIRKTKGCIEFYQEEVSQKSKHVHPKSTEIWEELFYHINFHWETIYLLPYTIVRETDIQSFQYKILHRYTACGENLNKWGKASSNISFSCNEVDTIEHALFYCQDSTIFWNFFQDWWCQHFRVTINLFVCDII